MKTKNNEFYDSLYRSELNIQNLKEQKLISPSKRVKRELISKSLKSFPKKASILEIGCGIGDIIGPLGFINKTGLDISKEALKKAEKLFPDTKFGFADANKKLKLKDKTFDAIILADVIEHIENDSLLLKETNRVLKSNGKLILFTPYSGKKQDVPLSADLNRENFGIGGDLRDYGWNLVERIEKSGFIVQKVRYINGPIGSITWKIKERLLNNKRTSTREKIMTGQFMNQSKTKKLFRKILSEILFRIYLLDANLSSNKNKPGVIFIVAFKK